MNDFYSCVSRASERACVQSDGVHGLSEMNLGDSCSLGIRDTSGIGACRSGVKVHTIWHRGMYKLRGYVR